jgi:hypothetical protein
VVNLPRRRNEIGRIFKLGHHAIQGRRVTAMPREGLMSRCDWLLESATVAIHPSPTYSSTSASGRIVRISKIEIIGRKRINRNSSVKKNPIVPINMLQSHCVGWYIPHDDGR